MVNKYAAPKCTSGYARNEKKQISKFHFPLKNAESKKQWIHFVNTRDWIATKQCCVNYILKKYLKQGEKCTLQWLMSHVTTVYPQKRLNKPSLLPTLQTTQSSQKKILLCQIFLCQHELSCNLPETMR